MGKFVGKELKNLALIFVKFWVNDKKILRFWADVTRFEQT